MKRAFTLIELLIAVTIIMMFAGLAIPAYNNFNQELKLKKNARQIATIMELARKKTISSELIPTPQVTPPTYCTEFQGYRVEIGAGSFNLMYGCAGVYTPVQAYDFEDNISVTAGGGNYDFSPSASGISLNVAVDTTITVRNAANTKCIDITISPNGLLSEDSPYSC